MEARRAELVAAELAGSGVNAAEGRPVVTLLVSAVLHQVPFSYHIIYIEKST